MNAALSSRNSQLVVYGIPTLVVAIAAILALTSLPSTYPELSIGILLDLTITAPVFLLLLSWRQGISSFAVGGFFLVGILIASFTIPAENQYLLSVIRIWVPMIAEASILAVLGYSTYRAVRAYKSRSQFDGDVLTILNQATSKMLGNSIFARFIAYEASVIYYAIFSWKKTEPSESQFTYHKKSGVIAVWFAFAFIILAETIVFHYLISLSNVYIAWALTISSSYTLLLILAQMKASTKRLIEIKNSELIVRYGIFGETKIELENIEDIEISTLVLDEKKPGQKRFGVFEQCNTRVSLKDETIAFGLYRFQSRYKTLIFNVDENEKLKKLIKQNVSD